MIGLTLVKCNPCRGARGRLINLTLVTQENREEWRKKERELKKKIADLENWKKKTKGKAAKDMEKQVHTPSCWPRMLPRQVRTRLISLVNLVN